MSQIPPGNPFAPSTQPPSLPLPIAAQPRAGMAVAALVCSAVGFCLPPVAIVGIILGIIAIVRSSSRPQEHGGKGMAIASLAVGGVALIGSCFWMSMFLLPSLTLARQTARETVDAANLRAIGIALVQYSEANKGRFPETADAWQARLPSLDPKMFKSPMDGGKAGYIYIPPRSNMVESTAIVAFTDPRVIPATGRGTILYVDGHVDTFSRADLIAKVTGLKLPDGSPALPPGSVTSSP